MEYLNSLKNLYGLNEPKLNDLLQTIKNNIFPNTIEQVKSQLNILMKQQTTIKNQIPSNKFNSINNFIIELYSYTNEFKSNSIKMNSSVNKVYDLSNYHMDSSVINSKNTRNIEAERLNIPRPRPTPKPKTNPKLNILEDIDPYKLYGYDKKVRIDIQDLKAKYKKYALQTHPDKNNGETKNFNIINEAFKVLFEDYKLKQNDKQFNELKNNSKSFIETQSKTNYQNTNINSDNFNVSKFNKIYSDHRISNANDDGYGDWSKDNEFDSEDIVRDSSLTKGNFNNMFEKNVKVSDQVVQYRNPKELFMNSENNCEELGVDKIENYTGKSKSINYTDYKEAHTTSRLVDPNANTNTRESYNSVNDLKAARSNIKDLTAEEIMEMELEKTRATELEETRRTNLTSHDNSHFENYNKIHNIMLSRR
jgi:curved DNA-binding protein CbpA